MPYVAPFLRLVMQGTTYPGEIFSTGLNIISRLGEQVSQPTDLAPYVSACTAWMQRPASLISSVAKMRTVKLNLIGTDGLYVNKSFTHLVDLVAPGIAGAGSGNVPAQQTMAVTLHSVATRGLASKGRLYPPLSTSTLDTSGLIGEANALGAANSMVTFIAALNAINASLQVGNVSNVREGEENGVRSVSVGRVFDTQRRRRSALGEARVFATTALPPA